jgi:Leucine-rich repeat (LRR) protein
LSDNNINQLPLNFQNLVNLKQLILSQNNFTSFPNLHGVSSNFTTLYLDGNEITTINQSDFEPLKRLTNWMSAQQ